jgi:hypothetical protein
VHHAERAKGASGTSTPLSSVAQPALLGAIAAYLHLTPAAVLIFRCIEEKPPAISSRTLLDTGKIRLAHDTQCRQYNRSKDCFDGVLNDVPRPSIEAFDFSQVPDAHALGMDACQAINIL